MLLHQLYFYLPLTVGNEVVKPISLKDFIQGNNPSQLGIAAAVWLLMSEALRQHSACSAITMFRPCRDSEVLEGNFKQLLLLHTAVHWITPIIL